ncbi:hypothetical protein AHAS_Ahas20G0171200 [Arachis hypogaea]
MKKFWGCVNQPTEEPDISTSASDHSGASTQDMDGGGGDPDPTLLITIGTEDRANF